MQNGLQHRLTEAHLHLQVWPVIHTYLTDKGVKSLAPEEVRSPLQSVLSTRIDPSI